MKILANILIASKDLNKYYLIMVDSKLYLSSYGDYYS